jgi:LacI family transcriptional regulator
VLTVVVLSVPWLPQTASTAGKPVDTLYNVLAVISCFVFALVVSILMVSVVHFRRRHNDLSDGEPIHGNTTLEAIWTTIPALLMVGAAVYSGLVLADIANPFYPDIAGGVIAAAADAGFEVFLSHCGEGGKLDGEEVRALCDQQCAALIFTSLVVSDGPLLADVVPFEVPIVQTVRRIPGLAADFVGIDDRAGARKAAAHLIELGHRDIALLPGPQVSSASHDRLLGFRETLADAGIEPAPERVLECQLTVDSGYRGAERLLAAGPEPPGAVLCGNDLIAIGAIDAFVDRGFTVPGDISVVGYDDIWFSSSRLVQLTTVRQPRHEMGRAAVALAFERLADAAVEPREVILPHEFVSRRTTARPARTPTVGVT